MVWRTSLFGLKMKNCIKWYSFETSTFSSESYFNFAGQFRAVLSNPNHFFIPNHRKITINFWPNLYQFLFKLSMFNPFSHGFWQKKHIMPDYTKPTKNYSKSWLKTFFNKFFQKQLNVEESSFWTSLQRKNFLFCGYCCIGNFQVDELRHFFFIRSNQGGIICTSQIRDSSSFNGNTTSPMFYSLTNYMLTIDIE